MGYVVHAYLIILILFIMFDISWTFHEMLDTLYININSLLSIIFRLILSKTLINILTLYRYMKDKLKGYNCLENIKSGIYLNNIRGEIGRKEGDQESN